MAQAIVSVHIKQFKYSIQHVLRQIVACGDPHSSFELGCNESKKEMVSRFYST